MSKRNRLNYESEDSFKTALSSDSEDDSADNETIRNNALKELKRIKFNSPPSHSLSLRPGDDDLNETDSDPMQYKGIYYDELPPSDKEFIACIGSRSGDMCYLTFRDDNEDESSSTADMSVTPKSLLKTSISELLEEVEKTRYENELKRKQAQNQRLHSTQVNHNTKDHHSELLVDKYAPKSYLDLLTDDKTNSEVLRWIKEWDPIVFPEKAKLKKPTIPQPSEKPTFGKRDTDKKFPKKNTIGPEQRILLISGPPGIGKTTLAHIAAKQAGYEPIEVNASDDRSKEKLLPEIQKVTQMQTVFGSKKPKLLILDEIDGVQNSEDRSVIAEILKMVYPKVSKSNESSETKNQPKKNKAGLKVEKKTKKKKDNGLMRPIICICNDHYSPGLKELRLRSKLFIFRRDDYRTDNTQRIVDRLSIILRKENILSDISKHDLTAFVRDSDNDIRACLNTLQFMSFDKNKSIKELMSITKDVKQDLFDALNTVFKTKKADKTKVNKFRENTTELYNSFLSELDKTDVLLNGCFENYPSYTSDSSIKDISQVLSSLQWSDIVDVASNRRQDRSLQVYRVLPLAKFFKKCKKTGFDTSPDLLNYPKKQSEVRRTSEHKLNVLKTLHMNGFSQPEFGEENDRIVPTNTSVKDLAYDIVPFLFRVLSTKHFSGLNSGSALSALAHSGISGLKQMMRSEHEREALSHILDVCISYGIGVKQTFVNDKHESTLDPPINELASYERKPEQENNKPKSLTPNKSTSSKDQPTTTNLISEGTKKILSSALHFEKLERKFKHTKKDTESNASSTSVTTAMEPPSYSPAKFTSAQTTIEQKKRRRSHTKGTISMYLEFHDGMTNSIRRPAKTNEFL